jgi:spore germination protein PC
MVRMYQHPLDWMDQRLKYLEQEIRRLQQENRQLKETIEQLKPVHIEKIEYKIHELHVETLSGTLNIGLTANGEDAGVGEIIEKMVDNHSSQIVVEDEEEKQEPAESSS